MKYEIVQQIIIKMQENLIFGSLFTASDFMYNNKVLISIDGAFNQSLNIQKGGYPIIRRYLFNRDLTVGN